MKKILSLNGLDKSGKTTQATRLYEHNKLVYRARKLAEYESWPSVGGEDFAKWWFLDGTSNRVVSTIYEALAFRGEDIQKVNCPLVVVDRGDEMFDAVCIATTAVREKCSSNEAEEFVKKIKGKFNFRSIDERVFFKTGDSIEEMLDLSKRRQRTNEGYESTAEIYREYQKVLSNVLLKQLKEGTYSRVIDATRNVNAVFSDTQKVVLDMFGLDVSDLEVVIGLGGLSECGKSSFGLYLQDQRNFDRLKIGQIIDQLGEEYKDYVAGLERGIYSVGDDLLASLFGERLIQRVKISGNKRLVIESLRNYGFTGALKRAMKGKFKIVYIDTPLELRIERNAKDLEGDLELSRREIARKDSVKISVGADKIKEIAYRVIDNSGTIEQGFIKLEELT